MDMKNMNSNRNKAVETAILLAALLILSGAALFAQVAEPVDPFYEKLLGDGKYFYQNGNYPEAIKNLEVAFFGLLDHPYKLLECYIYLGVSYSQIKNQEKSKYYFGEIKRLKLEESLPKLSLPKALLDSYREISASYGGAEPKIVNPPAQNPPVLKPPAAQPSKLAAKPAKPTEKPAAVPEAKKSAEDQIPPNYLLQARGENDLKKRINLYKQALDKDPSNMEAYFELNDAYTAAKKYSDAVRLLEGFVKNHPEIVRAHRELGKAYLNDKDYIQAIKTLVSCANYEPSDIEIRYLLGKAYMGAKGYQFAADQFDIVLAGDPNYKDARDLRKVCLDKIKK